MGAELKVSLMLQIVKFATSGKPQETPDFLMGVFWGFPGGFLMLQIWRFATSGKPQDFLVGVSWGFPDVADLTVHPLLSSKW